MPVKVPTNADVADDSSKDGLIDTSSAEVSTVAFRERMKRLAEEAGSANALAKRAGISQGGIRRYFEGGEPTRPILIALARAAGVEPRWLLTGEGPMRPGEHTNRPELSNGNHIDDPDLCFVPVYDVAASAGHGALVDQEQISRVIGFKQSWLRSEFQAAPQDLCLVHVSGESMEPTLRPGEVILVDQRHTRVASDGIYLVRLDDTILVKRLQKLPKGVIRVSSDNTAYQSFTISPDDPPDDFAILGRIIWAGRRL